MLVVKLVETNKKVIISEAEKLLHDENYYQTMAKGVSPYGDGKAATRIVSILKKFLSSWRLQGRLAASLLRAVF